LLKGQSNQQSPFANFTFGQSSVNKSFSELFTTQKTDVSSTSLAENETLIQTEKKIDAEIVGFGDKFKPATGFWNCETCYISNKPDLLYCLACESPKNSSVPKKEQNLLLSTSIDDKKFSFGVPNSSGFSFGVQNTMTPVSNPAISTPNMNSQILKNAQSSLITGTGGFSFGSAAPCASLQNKEIFEFEKPNIVADSTSFGFNFETFKPFSFGDNVVLKSSIETEPNVSVQEVGKSDAGFNFVFKKKSPAKIKSPGKARNDSVNSEGDEEEENAYHEEEENQTYFTPVIALPEKVEIKTGEENEETLFSKRAKLFRFVEKEWKERGIGDIKILRHRENGSLRFVFITNFGYIFKTKIIYFY
jgi:E3 SUMO-protein ligase RanBP2